MHNILIIWKTQQFMSECTNKYWGNWIIYTLSYINQLLRHTYLLFIFCINCNWIWIRKRNHLLLSPFCYRTSGYIKWIFLCLPYYLFLHCRWSCLRVCCRSMGCRRATGCSSTCQWFLRPSSRCWHVPAWGRYTHSSLAGSRRRNSLPGSITQRWVTIMVLTHEYIFLLHQSVLPLFIVSTEAPSYQMEHCSSPVERRTRNQGRPGSNLPLLPFKSLAFSFSVGMNRSTKGGEV